MGNSGDGQQFSPMPGSPSLSVQWSLVTSATMCSSSSQYIYMYVCLYLRSTPILTHVPTVLIHPSLPISVEPGSVSLVEP
jgi:hypothetical protein